MQQSPLPFHQLRQMPGHAVKILAKIGQFIAPFAHRGRHAGVELAAGSGLQGLAQATDGPRHVGGQERGENQADNRSRQQVSERQSGARWWREGRWWRELTAVGRRRPQLKGPQKIVVK